MPTIVFTNYKENDRVMERFYNTLKVNFSERKGHKATGLMG